MFIYPCFKNVTLDPYIHVFKSVCINVFVCSTINIPAGPWLHLDVHIEMPVCVQSFLGTCMCACMDMAMVTKVHMRTSVT